MLSRNNTFLSVHDIEFGISLFLRKTPNIIRIDHIKICLIVPFINQRGKTNVQSFKFLQILQINRPKICNKSLTRIIVRELIFVIIIKKVI